MRNFLAVIMLMFITLAFSNEKQVQVDNDVSIEQIMVKPLDVGIEISLEIKSIDTPSIDLVVIKRNPVINTLESFELFRTNGNLYKQIKNKDVPIQLLTHTIYKQSPRYCIRT